MKTAIHDMGTAIRAFRANHMGANPTYIAASAEVIREITSMPSWLCDDAGGLPVRDVKFNGIPVRAVRAAGFALIS